MTHSLMNNAASRVSKRQHVKHPELKLSTDVHKHIYSHFLTKHLNHQKPPAECDGSTP